jgi:large subunit ribosomal protein L24
VFVDGINMTTRHRRARSLQQAQAEGVTHQPGPIHISNVMLLDPKGKPTRVAVQREGGMRVRIAKSSGARID